MCFQPREQWQEITGQEESEAAYPLIYLLSKTIASVLEPSNTYIYPYGSVCILVSIP